MIKSTSCSEITRLDTNEPNINTLLWMSSPVTYTDFSYSCSWSLSLCSTEIYQTTKYVVFAGKGYESMGERMQLAYPHRFHYMTTQYDKFPDGTDDITIRSVVCCVCVCVWCVCQCIMCASIFYDVIVPPVVCKTVCLISEWWCLWAKMAIALDNKEWIVPSKFNNYADAYTHILITLPPSSYARMPILISSSPVQRLFATQHGRG